MTMVFQPGWEKPKIAVIPSDQALQAQRQGLSITKQKKLGISEKDIEYARQNNALREADQIFLSFFSETDMRNAIQYAHAAFNHSPEVKKLLDDAIGSAATVTIDQGTHQVEDLGDHGYKLHFDARPPGGKPCFHLYVGQNTWGGLRITAASFKRDELIKPSYV